MLGGLLLLKTKAMVMASSMLPMLLAGDVKNTDAFEKMAAPATSLLNSALNPLITLVGAAGALYCVLLGAKYAKAEEPQDREKAKKSLQNAIIGFLLIFVLLAALKVGLKPLTEWYEAL